MSCEENYNSIFTSEKQTFLEEVSQMKGTARGQ